MKTKKYKNNTEEDGIDFKLVILLSIFLISIVWIAFPFIISNYFEKWTDRGTFGDSYGVVNSLFSGLALAFIAISIFMQKRELELQRKELKETKNTFKLQRFENSLFSLIQIHHEIIDKLNIKKQYEKRDVFMACKNRLFNLIVGEGPDKKVVINGVPSKIKEFEIKDYNDSINRVEEGYDKFYSEFNIILSHYFNNLYNILGFILEQKEDKEYEKDLKLYLNTIKSQLSPDEKYLLYHDMIIRKIEEDKSFLILFSESFFDGIDKEGFYELRKNNKNFVKVQEQIFSILEIKFNRLKK